MKKTLLTICCLLALGFTASNAAAEPIELAFDDSYFVGYILPGNAPGDAAEFEWVKALVQMAPGTSEVWPSSGPDDTAYSSNNFASLPVPTTYQKFNTSVQPTGGIDVTAYNYVLAKYGSGGTHVWYVAGLGSVTVPDPIDIPGMNGGGLSHYALLDGVTVPDGGATLMLLGGALVGLGALRRKFRA